jgi:hypothetical protein
VVKICESRGEALNGLHIIDLSLTIYKLDQETKHEDRGSLAEGATIFVNGTTPSERPSWIADLQWEQF